MLHKPSTEIPLIHSKSEKFEFCETSIECVYSSPGAVVCDETGQLQKAIFLARVIILIFSVSCNGYGKHIIMLLFLGKRITYDTVILHYNVIDTIDVI